MAGVKSYLALMIGMATVTILAAAHAKTSVPEFNPSNITVIEKNQDFPIIGPQTYAPCSNEECTEV